MTPPEPTPWGTQRRLQALASRGWSAQAIHAATGIPARHLTAALTSHREPGPGFSRQVAAAYDQLWNQNPPQATTAGQRLAATARAAAERHGWPPPLAWDDDIIDLPNGKPAPGWKRTSTTRRAADLAEDVAWIQQQGGYRHAPLPVLAARLGVSHNTLTQSLIRAGKYQARAADRQAEAS